MGLLAPLYMRLLHWRLIGPIVFHLIKRQPTGQQRFSFADVPLAIAAEVDSPQSTGQPAAIVATSACDSVDYCRFC